MFKSVSPATKKRIWIDLFAAIFVLLALRVALYEATNVYMQQHPPSFMPWIPAALGALLFHIALIQPEDEFLKRARRGDSWGPKFCGASFALCLFAPFVWPGGLGLLLFVLTPLGYAVGFIVGALLPGRSP